MSQRRKQSPLGDKEKVSLLFLTLDRGADSLTVGEERRGGEGGDRGGGVIGALAGEVSGEASVEKGDCRRRMERSSEGLEEQ